ncbi:MAG: DUF4167 domain-containing protein [Alphaproteobacteria bacterium]|nr:DUF4167 domain-containing protein [Alphaproteobacteria bacterium]
MRPNQNNRRSRGRGGRKSGNPRNQTFDSNGPGARVRGNASQIYEKYQQLARDAASSGDRIASENFLQHAEHYFRVMAANGQRNEQRNNADDSQKDAADGNGADTAAADEAASNEDAAAKSDDDKPKANGARANGRKRRSRKTEESDDSGSSADDDRTGEEAEAASA